MSPTVRQLLGLAEDHPDDDGPDPALMPPADPAPPGGPDGCDHDEEEDP